MSIKKYLPNMTQAVQVTIVFVVLTVTGIGVALVTKTKSLMGRR